MAGGLLARAASSRLESRVARGLTLGVSQPYSQMSRRLYAPFLNELLETVETALFRYQELEQAAGRWVAHQGNVDAIVQAESAEYVHDIYSDEFDQDGF